mgnify:CR=1 FL=1
MGKEQLDVSKPLIIQVVGYKHTGKTTLVCKLVERWKSSSARIATIKHDAHDFNIDREGTDTWRHRQAGAAAVVIASPHRIAVMRSEPQPVQRGTDSERRQLDNLLAQLADMDVVLVEGYKSAAYPKIVLIREHAHWCLLDTLTNVVAAVYWPEAELPVSEANETDSSVLHIPLHEAAGPSMMDRLLAMHTSRDADDTE